MALDHLHDRRRVAVVEPVSALSGGPARAESAEAAADEKDAAARQERADAELRATEAQHEAEASMSEAERQRVEAQRLKQRAGKLDPHCSEHDVDPATGRDDDRAGTSYNDRHGNQAAAGRNVPDVDRRDDTTSRTAEPGTDDSRPEDRRPEDRRPEDRRNEPGVNR